MNLNRGTTNRTSINVLSSTWINNNVGLEGIAKGLSIYMNDVIDIMPPAQAYKDISWINDEVLSGN